MEQKDRDPLERFGDRLRKTQLGIKRRFFIDRYIRDEIARLHKAHHEQSAKVMFGGKRPETEHYESLADEIRELRLWQREIEDDRLFLKANKIGVYIDELDIPAADPNDIDNEGAYYRVGSFGMRHLRDEVRPILQKAVRAREPIYKKERREAIESWTKIIAPILTLLIGVIGALTALYTVTKK